MPLTFGLTGMDPATEAALTAAFNEANGRLGGQWQLLPDTQADHVVVDMDSMYGPMSWLRLHAADKTVIGLTAAARTQTDFRLSKPFDVDSVAELLAQMAAKARGEPAPEAPSTKAEAPAPAGLTPAPQPQDLLPEEQPLPVDEEVAPPPEPLAAVASHDPPIDPREPPSAAVGLVVPPAPTIQPHVPAAAAAANPAPASVPSPAATTPAPAAAPPPPPAPPAKEPSTLLEWMASGRLKGRVRFERGGVPLLIDFDQREYYGPSALKPLSAHFQGTVAANDFQPVAESDWGHQIGAYDGGQPLVRLLWFGSLLAGEGKLVPGFDPEARFQMLKWPQTEREYPKHFRIATAMMKGPSTLVEIAQASGVPVADVTDFVNANLATGFADVEHIPEPEPEPTKSSGLFGRLRGR